MAGGVYDEEVVHMSSRGKSILAIAFMVTLLFSGCGVKNGSDGMKTADNASTESTTEYQFLVEQDLVWKDNSIDAFQAVFNIPIQEIRSDGEVASSGTTHLFAGENGAVRFKNHYLGSKNSWSGVSGINLQGEEFNRNIFPDYDGMGVPVHYVGPMAGDTNFVGYRFVLNEKNQLIEQKYYVIDEKGEMCREICGKELFEIQVKDLAGDKDGNFHVLFPEGVRNLYVILSPNGEKIFETKISNSRFQVLDDGRVLVCEEMAEGSSIEGLRLLEADLEKGKTKVIALLSRETVVKEIKKCSLLCMTAKSNNEIIWCSDEGLYLCDAKGGDTKHLYRWANHGIHPFDIVGLYVRSDDSISVMYQDPDGLQFMVLKPTFEEREVKSITFAASPYNKESFISAAAIFNKRYPTYNIQIKDDYEITPLLTQLGAGEGPVLVDTELTGFETLEKLWQPLDGYLEQSGLAEDIIPQAMQAGKIDGKTYGIITNFSIKTLLVKNETLIGWNYHDFLQAVENFNGPIVTYWYTPDDARSIFFGFLNNGVDDNAFFDVEEGAVVFGTPEFERMLMLAEKARKGIAREDGKTLLDEKVLCEMEQIRCVCDLVSFRTRLESDKIYPAGYPTKNGARHILLSQMPIVIRSTATDEEKQMAYTFIKILLSCESAGKNAALPFSVRKDVLQKQFDSYEAAYMTSDGFPDIDREKEFNLYHELLDNSIAYKKFPADLQRVFDEEFDEYLNGEIPADLLDSRLKSRVELYLDER